MPLGKGGYLLKGHATCTEHLSGLLGARTEIFFQINLPTFTAWEQILSLKCYFHIYHAGWEEGKRVTWLNVTLSVQGWRALMAGESHVVNAFCGFFSLPYFLTIRTSMIIIYDRQSTDYQFYSERPNLSPRSLKSATVKIFVPEKWCPPGTEMEHDYLKKILFRPYFVFWGRAVEKPCA